MYKVDKNPKPEKKPLLPLRQTPGIYVVLFTSMTGFIILINTIVFLGISYESGSLFSPTQQALIKYGARDTIAVANGESWRLLTANFLHIGLLHYLFNNYALYIVGWNLENLWGRWRFLFLYLVTGIAGNVLSQLMSVNISAGASASIFGLFGSGLFVEWKLKSRLVESGIDTKNVSSAFAGLVGINILIGILVPQIDNAAHIGGLIAGVVLAFAYYLSPTNGKSEQKRSLSVSIILLLSAAIAVGAWFGGQKQGVKARLLDKLSSSDSPYEKYYVLTRLIDLEADSYQYKVQRLSLSLSYGDYETAAKDVKFCFESEGGRAQCQALVKMLSDSGLNKQSSWLEDKIKNNF